MKINIILITYNHSAYIKQTLEGVIMQKTSNEVEVIVADDASTDDTLDIIKEYASKSSFKYTYLLSDTNLGFNQNYKRAFEACNGDYIAIMEGDDYWTDPYRLEKHIQFLENHRECSLSFNRIIFYDQDNSDYKINDWGNTREDYKYYTSKQQIVGNRIGNLSACVLRTSFIRELKPELFELGIADWMLGIVFGQYGFLAELKEPMSVYRIHGNGQWSKQKEEAQIQHQIESIPAYNKYLDYKFNDDFIRYENYLRRVLQKQKKYSITDYIPPILVYIIKLLIPSRFINL